MIIGVLALQGNFAQHGALLRRMGDVAGARRGVAGTRRSAAREDVRVAYVRSMEDLRDCNGLIIPGGESTTIGMLLAKAGLHEPLQRAGARGFPLFGVCAGAILLAKRVVGREQRTLGVLDIDVERNGYGRQAHSFEALVPLEGGVAEGGGAKASAEAEGGQHARAMCGVFIRAPIIRRCGEGVVVLARYRDDVVVARQDSVLMATFHPELKKDDTLHRFFVSRCVREGRAFGEYL